MTTPKTTIVAALLGLFNLVPLSKILIAYQESIRPASAKIDNTEVQNLARDNFCILLQQPRSSVSGANQEHPTYPKEPCLSVANRCDK